jgi:hypothetical protein
VEPQVPADSAVVEQVLQAARQHQSQRLQIPAAAAAVVVTTTTVETLPVALVVRVS